MKTIDRTKVYDPFVMLEIVEICTKNARKVSDQNKDDEALDDVASALEMLFDHLEDSGSSNS